MREEPPQGVGAASLARSEVLRLAASYERYRRTTLNMIPSENALSDDVLAALASPMAGRYAGFPETYGGSGKFHEIWERCEGLARSVFRCRGASVVPVSGHVAGMMALEALAKRGASVASVPPSHGGYRGYSQPYVPAILGMEALELPFDPAAMNVDVEKAVVLVRREKPAVTVLGATVFLFPHPVKEIAEAAHAYGGKVVYDASHAMGLLAGSVFQDPLREGADVVVGSTHKTLFGPQGGIMFSDDEETVMRVAEGYAYRFVDNFHLNRVAALGVALEEVMLHGARYARDVVANSRTLAGALHAAGLPVAGAADGFTRSHQVLLPAGAKGVETMGRLEEAGIIVDSRVRFGTNETTRRGMGPKEMEEIAGLAALALLGGGARKARARSNALASRFRKLHYTLKDA